MSDQTELCDGERFGVRIDARRTTSGGNPTARPGGRAPHLWLADSSSLFDRFGFEWTLLRLGDTPADVGRFNVAARSFGLELSIVDITDRNAHDLYEAPLALIRPDQIVAWRGFDDRDAEAVLDRVTGRAGAAPSQL